MPYRNISELLPSWRCSFSRSPRRRYSRRASTEDDVASERHAEPGQEERGFKRLARQAPTPGLLAAPVPGQGFSRTTLVKREGDTQHPRALAVTLTVGILRFPLWLRESKRLSAAGSLNWLTRPEIPKRLHWQKEPSRPGVTAKASNSERDRPKGCSFPRGRFAHFTSTVLTYSKTASGLRQTSQIILARKLVSKHR